jgi:hypothetical protein
MDVMQERLERIMKIGERGSRRTPWCCWGAALVAAAVVLPGAAIGISDDEKHDDGVPAASPAPVPASAPGAAVPIGAGVGPLVKPMPDACVTRTYAVEDLLSRIQKEHNLNLAESKLFLKRALKACYASSRQVEARLRPAAGTNPDMIWNKDGLIVEATALGHRQVAETLDSLRANGTMEVAIRVYFVWPPVEKIRRMDWTALPADLPPSAAANYDGGPVPNYDGGPVGPTLLDHSFEANAGAPPSRVQRVVEKVSPLLYKIVDKKTEKALLDQWQSDTRTNILSAPRVTVFSGQAVCVSDCSQTPAVVGVKDDRPQIRVMTEGTAVQLRPIVDPKGELKLDFLVTLAAIRKVEMVQLSSL